MKLKYAPEAIDDIQQLKLYISKTLKNPTAAQRIVNMISRNCKQLKDQPNSGMSLEAKVGQPTELRYLICENWLAFYRLQDDTVEIVRILDGRADYLHVLFGR